MDPAATFTCPNYTAQTLSPQTVSGTVWVCQLPGGPRGERLMMLREEKNKKKIKVALEILQDLFAIYKTVSAAPHELGGSSGQGAEIDQLSTRERESTVSKEIPLGSNNWTVTRGQESS